MPYDKKHYEVVENKLTGETYIFKKYTATRRKRKRKYKRVYNKQLRNSLEFSNNGFFKKLTSWYKWYTE